MENLDAAIDTIQSIASAIIDTQEAIVILQKETQITLQCAGRECLRLETALKELQLESQAVIDDRKYSRIANVPYDDNFREMLRQWQSRDLINNPEGTA